MHSILFMILLFFESSMILALFNIEFFALLIILVYVGAVAVLFLFVVMLLDIKTESYDFYLLFNITFIAGSFIILKSYNFFIPFFYNAPQLGENQKITDPIVIESMDEIQALGQILYNYFLPCILIAGLILLFAMIGAISLTYNYNSLKKRKHSYPFKHISRSSNFLAFFQ